MSETKPGYKTSEFWLSLVVVILGALAASGLLAEGPWVKIAGVITTTLTAMGYGKFRTDVKSAEAIARAAASDGDLGK